MRKIRLQRKYNDLVHVRYNESTLKRIINRGFRSQFGQDYFLVENGLVPKAREDGSFVDIGCDHPVIGSNSYYFEKMRGDKGVAIDPVTKYEDEWSKERPNTIHINAFVSNSNDEIDFAEVDGPGGWESKLSGVADKVEVDAADIRY